MLASDSECIWIIVQERIGQPLPITSIFANEERLLGDNSVEGSYQIRAEDVSKELSFSCDWSQVGPGGEELYRGRESSQTLSIVLPPVLDNGTIARWVPPLIASQSEPESYKILKPEVFLRDWLSQCDDTVPSLSLGIGVQGDLGHSHGQGDSGAHFW